MDRRTALTRLAAIAGGIGVAFAAVPFVRYFLPSDRARALGSPISIDLSAIEAGRTRAFEWRGQTVLVMRRTPAQIEALALTNERLLDDDDPEASQPDYVSQGHRSRNPEFLVLLGNCTHLGCIPGQDVERGRSLIGDWWPGGFVCACHGSMFDYAGRVVRGPAPTNLKVPPHYFATANELVVGADAVDSTGS